MILITLLVVVAALLYAYLKWTYSYWKRNKVLGPEPRYFTGNMGNMFHLTEHMGDTFLKMYNQYPNKPYIGYFNLVKPTILVRDRDFVKDVLIKSFNSFGANSMAVSEIHDPLLCTNPFFLNDDEWKESRKTIMPAFSSSKMKSMLPVMKNVGQEFVDYIKSFPPGKEFDGKPLAVRFTSQNVLKCTFSIEPGCFDKNFDSEFLYIGADIFSTSSLIGVKMIAAPFLPKWLLNIIPIPYVSARVDKIVRKLVKENRASRSGITQNDIFQMLIELQEKHGLSENFLTGHLLSFFGDGSETSSIVIAFTLFELAANPQYQEILHDEIIKKTGVNGENMTYEVLQEMSYVEGALLESLRMHPVVTFMMKTSTKSFTLPKNSRQNEALTIEAGTPIAIPVLAIHMDPENYPNPEEFKPERFFPEEQRLRHNGTFLGFGEGPRICVGMRFGILQVKVALIYLIRNFRFKLSPKHKPIVLDPQAFLTVPKDGILMQFEPR